MLNFCTLFNSAYLSRGLVLYYSLEEQCENFHLYILAFDDKCLSFLQKLNLRYATIISLAEFETEALLEVKKGRTPAEYCWTCTPSIIDYCIKRYQLDNCTYVDADLMFFSNPAVLIEEMGNNSVLITEHRFSEEHDHSLSNGNYCVQFVTFKNTAEAIKVLEWWRIACIEWCYNRIEDGKFGDQKYLDSWTRDFAGVHELQHLGGGVAPWNVQQYSFQKAPGNNVVGTELASKEKFDLIFFHFHDFKYFMKDTLRVTSEAYRITNDVIDLIYRPYIAALGKVECKIKNLDPEQQYHEKELELEWIRRSLGRRIIFSFLGQYKTYFKKYKLIES